MHVSTQLWHNQCCSSCTMDILGSDLVVPGRFMHEDMSVRPRKGSALLRDAKVLAETLGDFVDRPHFINYTNDRRCTKANVDPAYLLRDSTQASIAAVKRVMLNMRTASGIWVQALVLINKDS